YAWIRYDGAVAVGNRGVRIAGEEEIRSGGAVRDDSVAVVKVGGLDGDGFRQPLLHFDRHIVEMLPSQPAGAGGVERVAHERRRQKRGARRARREELAAVVVDLVV